MENPYKLVNISNINVHYGNGAKNKLKEENKKYNFKFFYKIGTGYKNCSAGFDTIQSFINFIKPINKKYYIYEYIFENYKCVPYFDYEYELEKEPVKQDLIKNQTNINKNIKDVFKELFKIDLVDNQIIFMESHGKKPNKKFKVSFHIIITGYYINTNKECSFICEKIKELDENFDLSVYSKDRMMRTVCSAKDWEDNRILMPVDKKITIEDIYKYLITNCDEKNIKLKCPIKVKKDIIKKNYVKNNINKEVNLNDIGLKIEKIVKEEFHEDSYFTKSVIKYEDITFYGFNYTNRKEKCFTGFVHDKIGFYCYLDTQSNIMLKCFSANCKRCKKIIGNLNKINAFDKSININNKYLNEEKCVKELITNFGKTLLVKSNMGTGKTELVCDYINLHKPKRILWISIRQTYTSNINERLKKYNFINYLDDRDGFYTNNRIIVQLESLHYLERNFTIRPFDLIVLDEIESILYHFESSTIVENSLNTFNLLYFLCKQKNTKIIGMDADLNLRSLEYIRDIDPNYKIVTNDYKNEDIKVQMTNNKDYFINDIKTALTNKKKCCVISLSTKLLYQIEKLLIEWKVNYLMHTRDTDDKLKKELSHVNKLWIKYDIILYSPCISVGVDFTVKYFDNIYSIIIPNTGSSRIFKQMLGRIRNMKNNNILSYYKHVDINFDSVLYNYNEMIDYFKYCDHDIKTTKQYRLDSDNNIEVVNGFTLYDKIMMHNKIENLNKSNKNFITQLNLLFSDANYKIEFINNNIVHPNKKFELSDDVYIDKILNAEDIDSDDFDTYNYNILNNQATEKEKFSIYKYKFKNFWKLKKVDKTSLDLYFRCEYTYNRLLLLIGKKISNDEYIDYEYKSKSEVIKNIVKTLGFDLTNLEKKISKDEYYENVKLLLNENNLFRKNYNNIRILFDKDKHELKDEIKGSALVKLLNGFLSDFGLFIECKNTTKKIDNKKVVVYNYIISINKKYKF